MGILLEWVSAQSIFAVDRRKDGLDEIRQSFQEIRWTGNATGDKQHVDAEFGRWDDNSNMSSGEDVSWWLRSAVFTGASYDLLVPTKVTATRITGQGRQL